MPCIRPCYPMESAIGGLFIKIGDSFFVSKILQHVKNDDARNVKDENAKLNEEIWGDEHVERQGTKNQAREANDESSHKP